MNLADPLFEALRQAARPGEVSVGARHAALLLHAMDRPDQEWALQALPVEQRATLEGLLDELAALGIARDPALVAEAIAEIQPKAVSASAPAPFSMEDELQALNASQLERLIHVMRSEPTRLVAQWLRVRAWPWESAFLKGLPPDQRAAVTSILSVMPTTPIAPELRRVLVTAVTARLGAQPQSITVPARAARPSWHQAIVRAVRRAIQQRMPSKRVER